MIAAGPLSFLGIFASLLWLRGLQLDEPRPLAAGAFELRARGIRADSDGAAEHRDITVGQKL